MNARQARSLAAEIRLEFPRLRVQVEHVAQGVAAVVVRRSPLGPSWRLLTEEDYWRWLDMADRPAGSAAADP